MGLFEDSGAASGVVGVSVADEEGKPSCSTLRRICGGEEVRLELMRMSPAGVVMR
jgi:hypothetical protein